MPMGVGLVAGITAGCAVALGLVVSSILVWHWSRPRVTQTPDLEKGCAGGQPPSA